MPQASERSLATPITRPRFPAISPLLSPIGSGSKPALSRRHPTRAPSADHGDCRSRPVGVGERHDRRDRRERLADPVPPLVRRGRGARGAGGGDDRGHGRARRQAVAARGAAARARRARLRLLHQPRQPQGRRACRKPARRLVLSLEIAGPAGARRGRRRTRRRCRGAVFRVRAGAAAAKLVGLPRRPRTGRVLAGAAAPPARPPGVHSRRRALAPRAALPMSVVSAQGLQLRATATRAALAVAGVLIAAKFAAWLGSGSVALLSSLVDSLVDAAASLVNLLAVRAAVTPADREHLF